MAVVYHTYIKYPLGCFLKQQFLFCYLPLVCEFEYKRIFHFFPMALFHNLGKGSRDRGNLPFGIQHGDELLC